MRITCREGHASGPRTLVPRRPEVATQIDQAFDHALRRLQHSLKFRLPHSRALRPAHVVAKQQLVQRRMRHPRSRLLQHDFALYAILRPRGYLSRQNTSYRLGVDHFTVVVDESKTSLAQLIKIP